MAVKTRHADTTTRRMRGPRPASRPSTLLNRLFADERIGARSHLWVKRPMQALRICPTCRPRDGEILAASWMRVAGALSARTDPCYLPLRRTSLERNTVCNDLMQTER